MRTTITLDQDVYNAAAHLARASGRRLGKVLSELARQGLKQQDGHKAPKRRGQRWPTVQVPPGTPIIPASRIDKFLDEEGYV